MAEKQEAPLLGPDAARIRKLQSLAGDPALIPMLERHREDTEAQFAVSGG
jgi:hypothetical protein